MLSRYRACIYIIYVHIYIEIDLIEVIKQVFFLIFLKLTADQRTWGLAKFDSELWCRSVPTVSLCLFTADWSSSHVRCLVNSGASELLPSHALNLSLLLFVWTPPTLRLQTYKPPAWYVLYCLFLYKHQLLFHRGTDRVIYSAMHITILIIEYLLPHYLYLLWLMLL